MIQLPESFERNKFTYLMVILLLNILFLPALISFRLEDLPHIGLLLNSAGFTLILLFAIFMTGNKRIATLAILFIIPNLILTWARIGVVESDWRFVIRNIFDVIILSLVTYSIIKYIFSSKKITFDYISAALCVYLILGLLWVSLYDLAAVIEPVSFDLPEDSFGDFLGKEEYGGSVIRKLYFSFVTLLTLGYGDIVPIHSFARLLAILEALIGQIFMVVLVARLVGIHVAQSLEK